MPGRRASGEGDDSGAASRVFGIATGLVLAYYGNVIPKRSACVNPVSDSAARRQRLLRFSGWAFTLAGLAYAAIWAFAPLGDALWAMLPVAAALVLVAMRLRVPAICKGVGHDAHGLSFDLRVPDRDRCWRPPRTRSRMWRATGTDR